MNISVIGLGKLGSPLAACLASKGFNVTGVDINDNYVKCINLLQPPVIEPGLYKLLQECNGRIRATTDIIDAVQNTDATFIIVPTPSLPSGYFSLEYVLQACSDISVVLRDKSYHLVIITSTVMPGAMDTIRLYLEQLSGKKCGLDFGLVYNPEFVALGSVIRDILNPDLILIGESDRKAGNILVSIYNKLCINNPSINRMSIINAEITKLSINTYVTMKISFANNLGQICENISGADVGTITGAMGHDRRIGSSYLRSGLGYSGTCFPRDVTAMLALVSNLDLQAPLVCATDIINTNQIDRLFKLVYSVALPNNVIGILGLAYKPNTDIVTESQSVILASRLLEKKLNVIMYDPIAAYNASVVLNNKGRYTNNLSECCTNADVLVITTMHKELFNISSAMLKPNSTIIDCWGILDEVELEEHGINYIVLGRGPRGLE